MSCAAAPLMATMATIRFGGRVALLSMTERSRQCLLPRCSPELRTYLSTSTGADVDSGDDVGGRNVLILGSSGALGSSIVAHFFDDGIASRIVGADVLPPHNPGQAAMMSHFIPLEGGALGVAATLRSLADRLSRGMEKIDEEIAGSKNGRDPFGLDALICSAGGWIPTSSYASDDFVGDMETMLQMNLYPVVAATHVAATRLKRGGLFVMFGATAALEETPGNLAYGISKCAVHHLAQTLGAKGQMGAPVDAITVTSILPTILDTPANRSGFPIDADKSQWTKTTDVAEEIGRWITTPELRPHSGSLIKVLPNDNKGGGVVFRLVR